MPIHIIHHIHYSCVVLANNKSNTLIIITATTTKVGFAFHSIVDGIDNVMRTIFFAVSENNVLIALFIFYFRRRDRK